MGNQQNGLKESISISRKMLEHAQNEAWDDMEPVATKRDELLKNFFLNPVLPSDAMEVSAGIQEIIKLDREIMTLATANKKVLAEQLKTLGKGKKAVKAYT